MSFDPLKEIALELKRKMAKILSPGPSICITNAQGEIKYMDSGLKDRKDYIQEYATTNFNLIEDGQYAHPIPTILLAFFRMGPDLMFVLLSESGKIGNLLLYRGLLENYASIIIEVYSDLELLEEIERNANLVLQLTSKWASGAASEGGAEAEEAVAETPEVGTPIESAPEGVAPGAPVEGYPKLLERYRTKKFNFMEGIILQQCNGENTLSDIIGKTNYSREEVLSIVNTYQEKGWLAMLGRKGGKVIPSEVERVPPIKSKATTKLIEQMEEVVQSVKETAKGPTQLYPQLIEKFRNKKFSFKEGIILQFCNGKRSVEEIIKETKYTEDEVLEVINAYQKRGWLIINA